MNAKTKFDWGKLVHWRFFMPIVCLLLVLLVNVIQTPDFFVISINNGVLY